MTYGFLIPVSKIELFVKLARKLISASNSASLFMHDSEETDVSFVSPKK